MQNVPTWTTSVPSMIFLLYSTDGQCSESLAPPTTMYDLSGYAKSQNLVTQTQQQLTDFML